jgi:lipoprotein signal peptidase
MAQSNYRWLLWTLALLGATLDQGTKYGVFKWLYPQDAQAAYQGERDIFPGVFKLLAQYTSVREPADNLLAPLRTVSGELLPKVNQGALFGLAQEYAKLANALFAFVSLLAAAAIMIWSRRPTTARDLPLCAALGLILGGTLGNLYDRVVFHGVRDFLYFYYIEWPVFNVADCCLVCGAFLLLFQAFWSQPAAARNEATVTALPRPVPEVNGKVTSPA